MYYEETLFETIMNLEYRVVPRYKVRKRNVVGKKQPKLNRVKVKSRPKAKPNTYAAGLDKMYTDLVREGARIDITTQRRLQIREELTLIRKQKWMMKSEYDT